MNKTVKIKIPMTPNYLFDEKGNQYKIEEFTEKELRSIGRQWTADLIKRAARNLNPKP